METARKMISVAAHFCQADFVKFQKRDVSDIPNGDKPHPDPSNSFGNTYAEHRRALEFTVEQHQELSAYARLQGIYYACSVFDVQSVKDILTCDPAYIKIGSGVNHRQDILREVCENWPGEIHVSTGATTNGEIAELMSFLVGYGRGKNVVLYHCVSAYPTEFADACLLGIKELRFQWGDMVKSIAFSGHHRGISLDVAAQVLKASFIERHFTLDRTMKGSDQAASIEPDGLRKIVRDCQSVALAMNNKPRVIPACEFKFREKNKG